MRTIARNKQKMMYSNQTGKLPVYERDSEGNIKYIEVDGESIPVESGDWEMGYSNPIPFLGNIALSGGESQAIEFGVDVSSYDAVLVINKDMLPLSETSLIWFESEVAYKDTAKTQIEPNSADYKVTKDASTLNGGRYLLKRIVKNG